jgi:hypothetical protein
MSTRGSALPPGGGGGWPLPPGAAPGCSPGLRCLNFFMMPMM